MTFDAAARPKITQPFDKTLVEYAFEFAQDGTCPSIVEVRKKLRDMGFNRGEVEDHLNGPNLKRQITQLCRNARKG